MTSDAWRLPAALALALGLLLAPPARVSACDCALIELADAVEDADLAVVGTLVGQAGPAVAPGAAAGSEAAWTFKLERSRDPISTDMLTLVAAPNDGANCGVSFALEERWLVLVHRDDGAPRTNGCLPNRVLAGPDPEVDAIVATWHPVGGAERDPAPAIPAAAIGLVVGVAVIGLVSMWAFRRERVLS
jgi:hypothetical protein